MTAKGKLRQAVEELNELEAEQTLAFAARRREHDPVLERFENAPIEDEPSTTEENRSAAEAWEQRHDSISLDEFEREIGWTAGWRIGFTAPARRDLRRLDPPVQDASSPPCVRSWPTLPSVISSGFRGSTSTGCASATGASGSGSRPRSAVYVPRVLPRGRAYGR